MAPPRKSVSRGTGEREADPERSNRTVPRAPMPLVDDPEQHLDTAARPALDVPADEELDPERDKATQARLRLKARPPRAPAKLKGRNAKPEEEEYRTGPTYAALESPAPSPMEAPDEGLAGSQLEGEGLEALDPEVGSQTRTLKAHEREEVDEGDDEDSADDAADDDEASGADDANATRAGPPIKLEIFGGPDAGKKRRFKGARMVIGRTVGVDLRLSDQSVSRRHVELVLGEAGVLMRDLGSGNGTKVNGTRVAEKVLEHGDEIQIGKTKIRFVDEAAAFRKAREAAEKKEAEEKARVEAEEKARAEAEAKEKAEEEAQAAQAAQGEQPEAAAGEGEEEAGGKTTSIPKLAGRSVRAGRQEGPGNVWQRLSPSMRMIVAGVAALAVLIILAGLLLRTPGPPPVDPAKAAAEQKMQDARAAVRAADFETAVRLVEEAEKLLPGIDRSKLGNQAREELALSRALDEVKGHIAARRFEDAQRVLDKAPAGTNKSEEAKAQLRKDLETAQVAYKKEQIEEMIAAGEPASAKALLAELPVEQQEESAQKIAEFERQEEEQRRRDRIAQQQGQASAAAQRRAERAEEIMAAFSTVERKFAGGEWDRAASECNRVLDQASGDKDIRDRALMLQSAIPNFGRAYDEGMKKFRQGALAQAAKPLRQALELYRRMKLERNKYQSELDTRLGEASLAAGREALLRDDLVTAYQSFKDALKSDPSDSKAREGLSNVESKAQELFQMAYNIRDHDPAAALQKFRIVVHATDSSSSVHEKAKNHIAAMAP